MRRRRFGHGRRRSTPVTSSTLAARKRGKCRGCGTYYEAGDLIVVLRLKKAYRDPCSSCGHKPTGSKRYHSACAPADLEKAMGYDATKHVHNAPPTSAGTVPPPPKPASSRDALLASIAALENALVLKLRDTPKAWTVTNGKRTLLPEIESQFTTFQNIKQRSLRGATDGEQHAATSLALQRVIKLVFSL